MTDTQLLFAAIEAGETNRVQSLLDQDPALAHTRLVGRDENGALQPGHACPTPLQAAAMAGNLATVKLLIVRGAAIYAAAQWGYPAVAHAFWKKQMEVVAYLLGEAAGHASLAGAPTYGLGCDINLAARCGWTEQVRKHLAFDRLAVHRRGVIGETPLHWAAHNGHREIVAALLDAGADLEADEIGCYGGKPLHWASEHAPEIVEMLLARGAQVDSRNLRPGGHFEGVTPLIMVATQAEDYVRCAELLLDAGADLSATDAKGRSALAWATERGAGKVGQLLRQRGAA